MHSNKESEDNLMGRYFGTDGFRGKAGVGLTADHAYQIGRFLGYYYGRGHRATIVVGKDTRRSSYVLEYAISAGMAASGADVHLLHVTTTPSVSYMARNGAYDCGVMISASHNPFYDNGIKLINGDGEKMDEGVISLVEDYLDGKLMLDGEILEQLPMASGDAIGCIIDDVAGRDHYAQHLISLVQHSFQGKRVALDCANGSAWKLAPQIFEALGAEVHTIHANPDGLNINMDAGSTHIGALQRYVVENHMDVGFAFDGDADRCLAVDENGNVVTGDHIMYLYGCYLKSQGQLANNTVVTTVMSNFGLYKALDEVGISYEKTAVGDKYVYENMVKNGHCLGGEQSGHIIFSQHARTGDGILTALMIMEAMLAQGKTLTQLAAPVTIYPQVLINVRVHDKKTAQDDADVQAAVDAVANTLGDTGRILVRESGTEPLIRVMVEAPDHDQCQALAQQVVDVVIAKGHAV